MSFYILLGPLVPPFDLDLTFAGLPAVLGALLRLLWACEEDWQCRLQAAFGLLPGGNGRFRLQFHHPAAEVSRLFSCSMRSSCVKGLTERILVLTILPQRVCCRVAFHVAELYPHRDCMGAWPQFNRLSCSVSKNLHHNLIGDSKLSLCVIVSVVV